MTESEWLTATDSRVMLEHVRGTVSDRKLRLFASGSCRLTFSVNSTTSRTRLEKEKLGVQLAERIAEGEAPPSDQLTYHFEFHTIFHDYGSSLEWACHGATSPDAWEAASEVVKKLDAEVWGSGQQNIGVQVARDIFGNPFRPVAFSPAWRTETAVALASAIYADRAFDRMPILADALEEAGCDSTDVLAHCRGPGPHVRGCWVVDGVLGKS